MNNLCTRVGTDLQWLMESMLDLHLDPIPQFHSIYQKKRSFLAEHTASLCPLIYTIYKTNSIMQLAVKELALNYDKLDREQHLPELKQKMSIQHQNLLILAKTLSQLGNSIFFQTVLTNHLKEAIQPFIKGNLCFDQETLTQIERAPKDPLMAPKYLKELTEQRKNSPISNKAIQSQAKLFLTSRLADKGQIIKALDGTRNNQVYRLFPELVGEFPSKEIAFFKISSIESGENLSASGKMEAFMYDIAVVMGQEKLFTPTKEKALTWTGNTALETHKLRGIRGSIQPALQGQLLLDYLHTPPARRVSIDRHSLMKALLATIIFGMYDAHRANIFVNPKGGFKFFDNTRSLPHSNGMLLIDGLLDGPFELKTSFRISLVAFPECYEDLSDQDRLLLKTELANYKSKLLVLTNYLKSQKKRIATLPKGWFRPQAVLNSMNVRLQSVEAALQNPAVKNLRDILMGSLPGFKYLGALAIMTQGLYQKSFEKDQKVEDTTLDEMQQIYLKDVSFIDPLIGKANMFLNFDFSKFRKASKDPTIGINDLIRMGLKTHFKTPIAHQDRFNHYLEQIKAYNLEAGFCIKDVRNGRKKLEELLESNEFNKSRIRAELNYEVERDPFFDLPPENALSSSTDTATAQRWRKTTLLVKEQSYTIFSDLMLSQRTEGKIIVPETSQDRLGKLVDIYRKQEKGVFTHDEYPHLYFNYRSAEGILRRLLIDYETMPGTLLTRSEQITLKDLTALVEVNCRETKQIRKPQTSVDNSALTLNTNSTPPNPASQSQAPDIEESKQVGKVQTSEEDSSTLTLTPRANPLRHTAHDIPPNNLLADSAAAVC